MRENSSRIEGLHVTGCLVTLSITCNLTETKIRAIYEIRAKFLTRYFNKFQIKH